MSQHLHWLFSAFTLTRVMLFHPSRSNFPPGTFQILRRHTRLHGSRETAFVISLAEFVVRWRVGLSLILTLSAEQHIRFSQALLALLCQRMLKISPRQERQERCQVLFPLSVLFVLIYLLRLFFLCWLVLSSLTRESQSDFMDQPWV